MTNLTASRIFKTWLPLTVSWLLMALELPTISAAMARLTNAEINLAAYGGIVLPISLIIESPIVMLLAASTALSKDWQTYRKLYLFMMRLSGLLTVLHFAVAFTPLYDMVVLDWLGAPPEIIEPGRLGLRIMLPWTWSIAYRRFHQGVLIRFGYSDAIGVGTLIRLAGNLVGLGISAWLGLPGIAVGTSGVSVGVVSEAVYTGWRVQPVLRGKLRTATPVEPLEWRAFARFYIPLVLTSFLSLVWQPIGSAALSRMPLAIESLAVFPVVSGLIFMLRSGGMAYNEVVVALLEVPGSSHLLRRFAWGASAVLMTAHLAVAVTPLAGLWFNSVMALTPPLAEMARIAFWIGLPMPALNVLQSWYQGALLFGRETRGIPESVTAFLVVISAILGAGIAWGQNGVGLYIGMWSFTIGNAVQTAWLWWRARPVMAQVKLRDAG